MAKRPIPEAHSVEELIALHSPDPNYPYFENAAAHPFVPHAAAFDEVNSWWLAESALLVYNQREVVKGHMATAGFLPGQVACFGFDREHSTQCFVAHNDDFVIVSFRGTQLDDPRDIITDLNFALTDSGQGGLAHTGFREALDERSIGGPALWDKIVAHLRQVRTTQPVWFTGHSLGAALATLAADRFGQAQGLCTYGSPRVGDPAFVAQCVPQGVRFINEKDAVARVPLEKMGFKHVGDPRFLDEAGNILTAEPDHHHMPEDLLDLLHRGVHKLLKPFADHAPRIYATKLFNRVAA
ncbi:MAG: lipase family protein [Bryobacteraceae bacterium]